MRGWRGVLGARIVVGDHQEVGAAGAGLAHQGPLAAVTVTAGTDDDGDPPLRLPAQGRDDGFQCCRLVGVVDDCEEVLAPLDAFHPTRDVDVRDPGQSGVHVGSRRTADRGGQRGVGDVVVAG